MLAENYLQNPATEDLVMSGYRIKFTDVYFQRHAARILKLIDTSDDLANLRLNELSGVVWSGPNAGETTQIRPHWNKGAVLFPVHSGAAWVNQIILGIQGATTPCLRMPDLPVADPADGNDRIWNDGGVLTLGT